MTNKLKQKFKNSIKTSTKEIFLNDGTIIDFEDNFVGFYQGLGCGSQNFLSLEDTKNSDFKKNLNNWILEENGKEEKR